MCFRKFTHSLSCENHPLFTTVFEGRAHELIVNVFAEPTPCYRPACLADPKAQPLSVREKCPYHACCRISFVDLRCPKQCCPEQNEKKGRLEGGVLGLVSGPSYKNNVFECKHFACFHIYVFDFTRSVGDATKWRDVRYPYPDLLREDAVEAPEESALFRDVRLNLFRAGQRLLIAKEAHGKAQRDWDSARARKDALKELVDAVEERFRLSRSNGRAAQANYDDWNEMAALLEDHGSGRLSRLFRALIR